MLLHKREREKNICTYIHMKNKPRKQNYGDDVIRDLLNNQRKLLYFHLLNIINLGSERSSSSSPSTKFELLL